MQPKIIVRKSSVSLLALRWIITVIFRFFTGRPMDGRKRDNSKFLKGATRNGPGRGTLTEWQKKPHIHRALIRGSVFWPILGILALYLRDARDALLLVAFLSAVMAYPAFRRVRRIFFAPFTSTDAATGKVTQHWRIQTRWKRILHRQSVPGIVARNDRTQKEFPPDVERALREVIDAENSGIAPATRVRPVRK